MKNKFYKGIVNVIKYQYYGYKNGDLLGWEGVCSVNYIYIYILNESDKCHFIRKCQG